MAKENRCVLCGGRILPSGKCAGCGWDNSKKEPKYRLNAHNENTVHLHADDCEDNLNRDNDGSPVRLNLNREKPQDTQKKRTAGVQNSDNQKQSVSAGTGGSQAKNAAQAQRDSGSQTQTVKKSSSWASVNLNREKRKAQTTKTRAIRKQAARSEKTTKQFSSVDAAKKSSSKTKTKTKTLPPLIDDSETEAETNTTTQSGGGGKLLRRVIVVLVVIFIIVFVLGEFLDEFFPMLLVDVSDTIGEMVSDGMNGGDDYDDGDDDDWEDADSGKPELQQWDETADGYLTTELDQGNYYVGYDIPAGEYQLECLEGSAYATWESPDEEGGAYGFVILYSEEKQEDYNTYWGEEEECPWYELSPVFELSEGMVLNLDDASSGIVLTGVGEGIDSLKDHEPQSATESIYLSDDMTMTVGEDFEAGVYDIRVVVDGNTYAWVDVEKEDGMTDGISLSTYENMEDYLRYNLEDGDVVTVTTYGTDARIMLVPSW
ncbi:MAG: hypothetical protein LUI13_05635 [Lachnospiraceae bacterium]|nr:hypothetical protein [Lachnospiraceae bacterium]